MRVAVSHGSKPQPAWATISERSAASGSASIRRPTLPAAELAHGVVVDSVNVSVLLYAPVRSASLAPIDCLKPIVATSLLTGPP